MSIGGTDSKVYVEEIDRISASYLKCAQMGVFVNNVSGKYIQGYKWTANCRDLRGTAGDVSKAVVAQFLIDAYRADDIYFYRRSSDAPEQFHVYFTRHDWQ